MRLHEIQDWMMQNKAEDQWIARAEGKTTVGFDLVLLAQFARVHACAPVLFRHATLAIDEHEWLEFGPEPVVPAIAAARICPPSRPVTLPPLCPNLLNYRGSLPPPPAPDACRDTANVALSARVIALEDKVLELAAFIERLYTCHHELFEDEAQAEPTPQHSNSPAGDPSVPFLDNPSSERKTTGAGDWRDSYDRPAFNAAPGRTKPAFAR